MTLNYVIKRIKKDIFIYILLLPALLLTFIFSYLPMPGIFVAFQDFNIFKGILHSPFVGLKHIIEFIQTPQLIKAVRNTLEISVLYLVIGFPIPIILALLFNELKNGIFKRVIQTVSYLPYFLSWISIIGIFTSFYALYGPLNDLVVLLLGQGTERILFLAEQKLFIPNILFLSIWKEAGWGSVIYLAAITSIDSTLYEASGIDGASRFQQIRHITIPGIMPTAIILLILSLSGLFGSNFELIYGLKNPFIDFEVISTVVYKYGIQNSNYSLAAAVGFIQGLIAFLLIATSNYISKKVTEIGIW
jgi:putative aldouronate transport system permease protein